MNKLLEVCVDNLEDAVVAASEGADRLELCGALPVGGITPSDGFVRAAVEECGVPCVALVRPRSGDFLYTARELRGMRRDVEALRDAGCRAVMVGVLTPDARLDAEAVRELVEAAGEMEVGLHRAFDATRELSLTLELAIELGLRRVLTSGGAASAPEGSEVLGRLLREAAGRVEILPGGGIRSTNVAELLRISGASQVHASCGGMRASAMQERPAHLVLGRSESGDAGSWRVDPGELRALRDVLDASR